MKKVLYFFPDNIGIQTAGNKTRAIHLLKYFNQKGYEVDFASLKHEKIDKGTEQETIDFLRGNKLATNVFLLPRKPGKKNPLTYFFKYKIWDLLYYWFTYPLKSNIPTFLTVALKRSFEKILKTNTYDYIIISYVQCADLVSDKKLIKNAKTIIDTHDFITAQFKDKRRFNLGVTFEDEIKRLNLFDEVWAISPEEQYVFNQFCKSPVRLISIMMDEPASALAPITEKKYDIIYVASDNVHNIRAARWFFEKVYPLIPGARICVIGKINEYISDNRDVERIPFVKHLEPYYYDSKIAICPMFSGTGVKIKVVEALSFGLPVVCNLRGTDGLPNKINNGCLVSDDPVEFAQNIKKLLSDGSLYRQQNNYAKEVFNNNFKTDVVLRLLDEVFE
jgi:glycosyltransferase involved in cell wall biosynthesis